MALPFISILMPFYNSEAYLEKAIMSCVDQRYPYFELILINDASKDSSLVKALQLQKSYKCISKIITHCENLGEGAARKEAHKHAKGALVVWADSDDVQHQDRLQIIAETFCANPDLDILMHSGRLIDSFGIPLKRRLSWPQDFSKHPLLWELSRNHFLGGFSAHKNAIGVHFAANMRCSPDYDFFLRCLIQGRRFLFLEEELTDYRLHGNNLSLNYTLSKDLAKKTLSCLNDEKILERLLEEGCPEGRIYTHLAEMCLQMQNSEKALKYLTKAQEKCPSDPYSIAFYRAIAHWQKKDLPLALKALEQALSLRPKEATALNNLGVLMHHMGKEDKALDFFHKALEEKPLYKDAQKNIEALQKGSPACFLTEKILRPSWVHL